MTDIVQLQNDENQDIFPVTNTKAIYDDEGNRLDNVMLTAGKGTDSPDVKINAQSCNGVVLGIDGEGNRGYFKADGSFSPFNVLSLKSIRIQHSINSSTNNITLTDVGNRTLNYSFNGSNYGYGKNTKSVFGYDVTVNIDPYNNPVLYVTIVTPNGKTIEKSQNLNLNNASYPYDVTFQLA